MQQLWFKIGDAARIIGVTPKDLRYWELNLESFKSKRSQGNLRYYHRDDLPIFQKMRQLIDSGLSIREAAREASKITLPQDPDIFVPHNEILLDQNSIVITDKDTDSDLMMQMRRREQIQVAKASLREMIDQLSRPIIIT